MSCSGSYSSNFMMSSMMLGCCLLGLSFSGFLLMDLMNCGSFYGILFSMMVGLFRLVIGMGLGWLVVVVV